MAIFNGTTGNDGLTGGVDDDSISGLAGNDTLSGGEGNDTIDGGADNDIVVGGAGDDVLVGGEGADTLRGGSGNDSIDGNSVLDRVNYTDGNSLSYGDSSAAINLDLSGITGDGSTGTGTAQDGLGGTDTLANVNFITGSAHDDTITGSGAAIFEQFEGGAGNDTIDGGTLTDTLNGADGNRANYTNASGAVTVDLLAGTATGGAGDDVLINITQVRGSASNDTLLGSDRSNYTETFEGRAGNDSINGRGGFDILRYDSATSGVNVSLATGTGTDGLGGFDSFSNIEGLQGSSYDDTLTGGLAANGTVTTDGLSEVFRGGAGNDIIDGGQGYDRVDYTSSTTGAVVTLNDTADGAASDGLGGTDVLRNIEAVRGSDFADTLTGSDTAAFESFEGRAGDDVIDGNGGVDRVDYSLSTSGINVDLGLGSASDGVGGTDTLSDIENVRGSRDFDDTITGSSANNLLQGQGGNDSLAGGGANDTLEGGNGLDWIAGDAGNDSLDGGAGNDTLEGGAGQDTLVGGAGDDSIDGGEILDRLNYSDLNVVSYAGSTGAVNVNLAGGSAQDGLGGTDTLANVNFVTGSGHNDVLTGSSTADLFEQFDGGAGNDTIDGGAINAVTQNNSNRVTYAGAGAAVQVNLALGTAAGGGGNDSLTNINHVRGSAHGDSLLGSDSGLTEQFEGMAGNDTINGQGGTDMVRYDNASAAVTVNLGANTATETHIVNGGAVVSTDTLLNIEGVRGSNHADVITGGNAANGAGALDGFEFFIGNGGNDTINGAAGYDRVDYTTSTAGANVTLGGTSAGTAQDGLGGTDTLQSIEAVRGSGFNDTLTGSDTGAFESFEGRQGDDLMDGKGGIDRADYSGDVAAVVVTLATGSATDSWGGTDTLLNMENVRGSSFNDMLSGDALANRIEGAAGNDSIDGAQGNDTLLGGTGVDTVDGGADTDTLVVLGASSAYSVAYPNGTDTVLVNAATGENITIRNVEFVQFTNGTRSVNQLQSVATSGPDQLVGTPGADSIDGLAGNDTITGLSGNDTLIGGLGIDSLVGGAGNDVYVLDVATDQVLEVDGEGTDTVNAAFAAAGTYLMTANVEHATVTAGAAVAVSITGNELSNVLTGNAAANILRGNGGDDTLDGGAGTDNLIGGAGNDTYVVNVASDIVNETLGGSGSDTVNVAFTALGTYVMTLGVENAFISTGTAGVNITGSADNNLITGNAANNILLGNAGNDTLSGLEGNDTLTGGQGVDYLEGGGGNDSIQGNELSDAVSGGAGNDTLDGGAVLDKLNLSDGNTLDYSDDPGAVNINLVTGTVLDGFGGTDKVSNFQFVFGSNQDDTILGTTGAGFEMFEGLGGNDAIDGGVIADKLNSTDSNRVNYTYATAAVSVDLQADINGWQHASGGAGNDLLKNFNQVRGGDFNDSIYGSDRTDVSEVFEGRGGNNTIDGRGGIDLVRYEGAASSDGIQGVYVNLVDNTATHTYRDGNGDFVVGTDTFSNIEGIQGSRFNDTLVGGNAANGVALDDGLIEVFRGGAGSDSIDGGQGWDRADYTSSTSGANINLSTGIVSDGLGGQDTLVGIEAIRATDLNDTILGGTGDYESFEGRAGNDLINGGGGYADRADYISSSGGVNVNLTNTATTGGTAADGWGGTDTLLGITDVRGSAFNDTILGSAGMNWLEGRSGNDSINGAAGNDTIVAGTGVDIVDGGADTDTLVVNGAFADYAPVTRPNTTDTVLVSLTPNESITLRNIEFIQFTDGIRALSEVQGNVPSGFNDALAGGDGADSIDGLAGNDTITGLGGDDTLIGGLGIDSLIGGVGNDTYFLDVAGDQVVEVADEGTDTVNVGFAAAATYSLAGTFIDNAKVTSGATIAINLTGNELGNELTGNGAANILRGNGGDDTLDGGAGTDNLIGGAGNDTYVVNVASDIVNETLGGSGSDTVNVAFTALGTYVMTLGVENAFISTGTAGVNITGSADNNLITGNAANNILLGNAGNDTLAGGGSTGTGDTLDGGAGDDLVDMLGDSVDYVPFRISSSDTRLTNTVTGEIVVLRNVENVRFADDVVKSMNDLWGNDPSLFADALVGTEDPESIDGLAGNDTITGLGGDDTLIGGLGADSLVGGDGNDLYVVDLAGVAGDLIVENAGEGTDTVNVALTVAGIYIMGAEIENGTVTAGGVLAVGIIGNGLDNVLTGNANANALTGADGNDTLVGNAGNDTLTGGAGNDSLDGGIGTDSLAGGAGDDTYIINVTTDVVTEGLSAGTDTVNLVFGAGATYTMTPNVENANIANSTSGVNITGNLLANALNGNAGNNILIGGDGNDTIAGNGGTDVVDGGLGAADVVVLSGSAEDYLITRPTLTQTVFSRAGVQVTVSNVEFVQFDAGGPQAYSSVVAQTGSPGNDVLTGFAGDDVLDGALGNDSVSGMDGDDTLFGGAGNDTVAGGAGTDILDGGAGVDTYLYSQGDGDDLIDQNDTVAGVIDTLVLTQAGLTDGQVTFTRGYQTYNDLVVNITQADESVDHVAIVGFFSNDAVSIGAVDRVQVVIDGLVQVYTQTMLAAQALLDGDGDHIFVGYNIADVITGSLAGDWISSGNGNDVVNAGEGDDVAFGGAGADQLNGGDGADLLVGGAGADTMSGGIGNDTLSGGAGSDLYRIEAGGGDDVIGESIPLLTDEQLQSGIGPMYVVGDGDAPLAADTDTLSFLAGIVEADVRATRSGNDLVFTIGGSDTVTVTNYFANGVATIERVQFASGATWSATAIRAKVLVPTSGDDEITGYLGGDRLNGLAGDDTLHGREGNDILTGGDGNDVLTGGSGSDRFVFNVTPDELNNLDTITDFQSGVDTIVLSAAVFTAFSGLVGTRVGLSENLTYDNGTGALGYDADGAGGDLAVTIAIIGVGAHPASLGTDFVIGA